MPSESTLAEQRTEAKIITRILFGSCIKQEKPMPILKTMLVEQADLVLFAGDNIYADTSDMAVMRTKYAQLAANVDFARLRSRVPVLATWDDHDYGINDGGADFPMRAAAQKEFMDFWRVPEGSSRRQREGVYHSQLFGPQGKRLQIILLDTRYFRSTLKKGERRVGGPYIPDPDPAKTMLGGAQWKWLESELRRPADLRMIVTSVQCLAEASGQETWSNLPRERERLLDLIDQTGARGVVLLSGDRHWSELSMIDEGVPYPLYELTSSSFNQRHARGTPTENRYRISDTTYHRENYGMIAIDWDAQDLILQIRDLKGQVRIEKQIPFDQLRR